MTTFAPLLLATAFLSASDDVSPGLKLVYQGQIQAEQADDLAGTRKRFELTLLVTARSNTGAELIWAVDDTGRGGWPWSGRFGRVVLDENLRSAAGGPSLLYDRSAGTSVVPLLMPILSTATPPAEGLKWSREGLNYTIGTAERLDGRDVWPVDVQSRFGYKRTLWLDHSSPLIVKVKERVVIGQGERYQMQWQLIRRSNLPSEPLQKIKALSDGLVSVRESLNIELRKREPDLDAKQLVKLQELLPKLTKLASDVEVAKSPWAKAVTLAAADLKTFSLRGDALATLAGKQVGRQVKPFALSDLANQRFSHADLQGKVTVLHFWGYRDKPLREPYGQIGYLDFLNNRHQGKKLSVMGVAVDTAPGGQAAKDKAGRSVRKLRSFMNLGYRILLDDGSLLKQFGDPRETGAKLPLFVVIGPDGKVIHYHVGHYDVDPARGLKRLDEVVTRALK